MTKDELEKRITERFADMPPKIKQAARYVLDGPKEIALQSMRAIARRAGLQPASMLRLARDLDFESYEDFRAVYVAWLSGGGAGLLERAEQLRQRSRTGGDNQLLADLLNNEVENLDATLGKRNEKAFHDAQKALSSAQRIYILGLRSFFPPAFYLHYVLSTFRSDVTLLSGTGGTYADDLRRIGKKDVLVGFSARPYTAVSVDATNFARERGAKIIAIADSAVSPVAAQADICILAPNTSLSLFPSILPVVAAAQTLVQLMIVHGGEETLAEVANSEAQLRKFNVYTPQD